MDESLSNSVEEMCTDGDKTVINAAPVLSIEEVSDASGRVQKMETG